MQYLIQVSGNITDRQNKTYVINSDSAENAQMIAAENFCNEFNTDYDSLSVNSHKRTVRAIVSFVFMLIPILLSLINWKNGHETISISPDYISCGLAAIFYLAFIVRFKGFNRTIGSWIDITYCILTILLMSTFIKTILVTKSIPLFGLTELNIDTSFILAVAIILSWLGLKLVSLLGIGAVALLAFFRIAALSESMGAIWGPVYIICALIGMMMYLSVEPSFIESANQIKYAAFKSVNRLNKDMAIAKNQATKTKEKITQRNQTSSNNEAKGE